MKKIIKKSLIKLYIIIAIFIITSATEIVHLQQSTTTYQTFKPYFFLASFAVPFAVFVAGTLIVDFNYLFKNFYNNEPTVLGSNRTLFTRMVIVIVSIVVALYRNSTCYFLNFRDFFGPLTTFGDMYLRDFIPLLIIFILGIAYQLITILFTFKK